MATKPRITISLPEHEYREHSALAEKHRISLAWLGRQAVAQFLERYRDRQLQLPLTMPLGINQRMIGKHWTAIDLFCGAGGLSDGFRQAGFHVLAGNDIDPYAAETFVASHAEVQFLPCLSWGDTL